MFLKAKSFNQPFDDWNVSNVTNMRCMFQNVSNVADMDSMFRDATSFNQPLNTSVNKWNVSKVTDMNGMFYGASSFNQPLNR